MGKGGKVVYKRRRGGGGGWGARARRGGGSDDASDEEYVVGEDEEEESSNDSYSSDASREASEDAEQEEDDEEDDDDDEEEEYVLEEDDEEEDFARTRRQRGRPRNGSAGSRATPAAKPLRKRASAVADGDEEMEIPTIPTPLVRRPRPRQRARPGILVEEEEDEWEDDDDEDFAPDEDEDDEEELGRARGWEGKASGARSRRVKRQRRRRIPNKSNVKGKIEKTLVRRRRRSRAAPSSDDDDFVVKDRVSLDGARKKKRRTANTGRRRRSWVSSSDPSGSDSSDLDYTISVEESRDRHVGLPLGHRERVPPPSGGVQGEEKGKGKEIDDPGRRVCGICLSEENGRVIQGVLDCCAHYFCFACIMEWSKVESRCPVCKRRFKTVTKSARSDAGFGLRTAIVRIPKRDQVYQPSEEEMRGYLDPYANVVCIECQQGGDDNLMLLCDICDSPAHTYCVGLGREVPAGNWYCDGCRSTDLSSLNSRVQESPVEQGTRNSNMLEREFSGGIDSGNVAMCTSHGIPELSCLLCQPPSEGISQGTSIRCQYSGGDCGTSSRASGFAASTVSGRRSIHRRIRIILSNSRVGWIPDIARNDMIQPSSLGSSHRNSELERNGETCHISQEGLMNGMNWRSNRSLLGPTISWHQRMNNEGSSCHEVEGAKKQVKSIVKNHLSHLSRDTSLGRGDFKEIARRATHNILAACGFQHRRSMVTTTVQVPSKCMHLAGGEPASLVKGCCSSCFTSFAGNVVQEIFNLKLRSA